MKKLFLCLALIFILAGQAFCADKTIKMANLPWLPYSGQFLPNYGIALELVTEAFKREGYRVDYSFMSWRKALQDVETGKFDAVATAYYTDDRAKKYIFSKPYLESPIVFFKRKDSPIEWETLEDLRDYKIGVVRGYANSPEFDSADYLRKVISWSETLLLKKLILKQADLIVMDELVGHYNIRNKLYGPDKKKLEPLYPPLVVNKLYVIFSRNIPDGKRKVEIFNRGLQKIKEDGTLKKILAKYGLKR